MEKDVTYKQSQSYGFFMEGLIREVVFGIKSKKNSTDKYDVDAFENRFGDGHGHIKEVMEIAYTQEVHSFLFGSISAEEIKAYVALIKSIEKGKVDDSVKNRYKKKKKEMQEANAMFLTINPKVDSKAQRRVQCSFNLEKLIKKIPECLKYRNKEGIIRGVSIPKETISDPRKFKDK